MDGLIKIMTQHIYVFPLIAALIVFFIAHKLMGG